MYMLNTRTISIIFFTSLALLIFSSCATKVPEPKKFNPRTCLNEKPQIPEGIKILKGQRSARNIAQDMHPAWCNGQVLFRQIHEKGTLASSGTIVFEVTVEYTGEAISVRILESDIQSGKFNRKISDMIMDSNFTPRRRSGDNAIFVYPMTFSVWWE